MRLLDNVFKTLGIATIFVAGSGVAMAQNTNVVSAALEFNKFERAIAMQKVEDAEKSIVDAKEYIDLAMQHESTKNDEKAHYYNALINFGMVQIAGLDAEGDKYGAYQGDSIKGVIKNSIEIASKKRRWKGDLEDYFNGKTSQAIMIGEMMFKSSNYEMAFAGFASAYVIKDVAGIEEQKDDMMTNAVISAVRYIDTLTQQGKQEDAMKFVEGAMQVLPDSDQIAIEGVNLALGQDDLERAEAFFNVAAKNSPNNKELFSSMGSIYLAQADAENTKFVEMSIADDGYQEMSEHVEDLYTKAENNLKHALKIDPDYAEAAYNLGVLYLGRGEMLRSAASQMGLYNPDYEATNERSVQMYTNAIEPLETYIKHDPNNSGVLRVLFQVHRHAGNDEKAMEYRKRAEEVEAGE